MKTLIQINGKDFITPISHGQSAVKVIKGLVKANGIEWKEARIFVPDYPSKGRYMIKSPGYVTLMAGG